MMNKLIATCSFLFLCAPAIALPKTELQQIKSCIAIGGTRGQASPTKSLTVLGSTKGYHLLRIADRAGNTPYERIIRLHPCRTVYIDQSGQTPSKYGIPFLPAAIVDELSIQSVRFDLRQQGKRQYFSKIIASARNGRLEMVPETYKALKKEGFSTKNKVILYGSK